MQAGKLRDRITLHGARQGQPAEWPELGKAWAEFREPQSLGRDETTSIRAPGSTFVRLRYRTDLRQGQLLRRAGSWYVVESAEPGLHSRELILAARRIVGEQATYWKQGESTEHTVQAFLKRENLHVGAMNEPRFQIELFQPELPDQPGRRNDQITFRGTTYSVDGVVEGTDDGVTLTVLARY